MSGRSQFYMNLGMTLSIGMYAVGGAFFSELFKGPNEWSGRILALELVVWLGLLAATVACFIAASSTIHNDRE